MANILVNLEHGIEVAAKDVLTFLAGVQSVVTTAEPGVVAALGVLLGTVETAIADLSVAVTEPLNISIDVATLNEIRAVWPALVIFAASLGIKL